jgi:hypothetical protein
MGRFLWALLGSLTVACAVQSEDVFFGNLHSHTRNSDGSGTPDEAYKYARDVGKLDFLAITDHNHQAAEEGAGERKDGILIAKKHSLYEKNARHNSTIDVASTINETPGFLALYGQEFSSISKGNHINVFDVPLVIDDAQVPNGDFKGLIAWIENAAHFDSTGQKAILQFNHPSASLRGAKVEYGMQQFGSQQTWIDTMGKYTCLIEILNGPGTHNVNGAKPEVFESDYFHYLRLGFRVAPSGDQDNHYKTWGTETNARTGVIAEELTKKAILAAIRARHVYATDSPQLKVIIKGSVNGQSFMCGDVVKANAGTMVHVQCAIQDDDDSNAAFSIEPIIGEIGSEKPLQKEPLQHTVDKAEFDVKYEGGRRYFVFKITEETEHNRKGVAWTSALWIDPQ